MGSFDGVADIYDKSRHGYPSALRDHLVEIEALTPYAAVVDLGAGTGQLAVMAATVAPNVVAIDPEGDMVRVGREATKDRPGIRWLLGADRDVLQLLEPPIDLVLIGNAFHHMDQPRLLACLDALVSPAGHVVICSTSIPVWLQDTDWSAVLRDRLSEQLGREVGRGGTPDHDSDLLVLEASAFADIEEWLYERTQLRSADDVVGEIVSSASGAIDIAAAELLRSALDPYVTDGMVIENVRTTALIGKRPNDDTAH